MRRVRSVFGWLTLTLPVARETVKRLLWGLGSLVFVLLAACAGGGVPPQDRSLLPGDVSAYSWGYSQKREGAANIERAQSDLMMAATVRAWTDIPVERTATMSIGNLQTYFPMRARWKLKDGREFVVERIDVRTIMRDYFKSHEIRMPWQKEGRPRARFGDYNPVLVHEIAEDTVRIKWVVITNLTPVSDRLGAGGAANPWRLTEEEFLVATIKGVPTSGIDFNNRYDSKK